MNATRGVLVFVLLALNLALWGTPVLLLGLGKLFLRGSARRQLILTLASLAERYVAANALIFRAFLPTKFDVTGADGLMRDGHYLIVSNHLSWVDIFVLFHAFHRRVALLRFFIKQELIWLPFAGLAAWALEFPFMKRYSPEYLARHPEKRGTDLATTRRACQRYRTIPVAILNFLEGTRFTRDKQADQDSPYRFLLRPRVGGVAFVLASLGDQLDGIIDVTIGYPGNDADMWDFVTGRVPVIRVRARRLDVPAEFYDPSIAEPGPARERFKAWIDEVWRQKDELLATLT